MAKKSKKAENQQDNPVSEMSAEKVESTAKSSVDAAAPQTAEQTEIKKPRQPQLVTLNGDNVSHVHVFKSDRSDNWFVTGKINDVPLKPQVITKEHLDKFMSKEYGATEMMLLYYPTKMLEKVKPEEMKLPQTVMTPAGEQTVHKFKVYKETDSSNAYVGQYRFYAQVGDMKMSTTPSKWELNNYFDKTMSVSQLVTSAFGERLHMADHYDMYKLPKDSGIDDKDIRLTKNKDNHYEISVKLPNGERTPGKEVSFDDRKSFFEYKTATKENLAVKYLNVEISSGLKAPHMEKAKQQTLSL